MTADLCALSATALLDAYRKHELSPVEVTRAVLERIEKLNPVLNAFNLVSQRAMDDAKASEARWMLRPSTTFFAMSFAVVNAVSLIGCGCHDS